MLRLLIFGVLLLPLGLAVGQSGLPEDELPLLDLDAPLRLNFAGNWQKDFARSDNWETELERIIDEAREAVERQRRALESGGRPGPIINMPRLRSNRGTHMVELARLAEYISRQSTIRIEQSRNEVRVIRAGEADLTCPVEPGPTQTFHSVYGTETCGWEGRQLVFRIDLPDALAIVHRFAVASDRSTLQLITTVSSGNGAPFSLRQTYDRYEVPPDRFSCGQTVSRGTVCRRQAEPGEP